MEYTIASWSTSGSPQKHMAQNSGSEVQASREVLEGAEADFNKPSVMAHGRG